MQTPIDTIEKTIERLKNKVGPDGYYAQEISRVEEEYEELRSAKEAEERSLEEWRHILDVVRAEKRDHALFREEFLRRHHPELKPHEGIRLYTEPELDDNGFIRS